MEFPVFNKNEETKKRTNEPKKKPEMLLSLGVCDARQKLAYFPDLHFLYKVAIEFRVLMS